MNTIVRDDLSRFLVHLTRDNEIGKAEDNLISILNEKFLIARNAHCLFHPKFAALRFSDKLKSKFNTVCFTEVPFAQLKHIAKEIKGRSIELKPFGLVFKKEHLLKAGASPAIYVNADGPGLRTYLLRQFEAILKNIELIENLVNALKSWAIP